MSISNSSYWNHGEFDGNMVSLTEVSFGGFFREGVEDWIHGIIWHWSILRSSTWLPDSLFWKVLLLWRNWGILLPLEPGQAFPSILGVCQHWLKIWLQGATNSSWEKAERWPWNHSGLNSEIWSLVSPCCSTHHSAHHNCIRPLQTVLNTQALLGSAWLVVSLGWDT